MPYAVEEHENICPWCIASGRAAKKFDAHFCDDVPLLEENVPKKVVEEVTRRTPGFFSWQQEVWLSHCGDACAFLGDATREDIASLKGAKLEAFLEKEMLDRPYWDGLVARYTPGGQAGIYKFICLHCGEAQFGIDFS